MDGCGVSLNDLYYLVLPAQNFASNIRPALITATDYPPFASCSLDRESKFRSDRIVSWMWLHGTVSQEDVSMIIIIIMFIRRSWESIDLRPKTYAISRDQTWSDFFFILWVIGSCACRTSPLYTLLMLFNTPRHQRHRRNWQNEIEHDIGHS